MIVCCVWHRYRRAINQLDLTPAPLPLAGLLLTQALGNRPPQALHQGQGQTLARLAIRPRVQAAGCSIQTYPLARPTSHRILATVIRTHHLFYEQHHSTQRAVHPLSIRTHLFAYPALQFIDRNDLSQQRLPGLHELRRKLFDLLRKSLDLVTIHRGCSSRDFQHGFRHPHGSPARLSAPPIFLIHKDSWS